MASTERENLQGDGQKKEELTRWQRMQKSIWDSDEKKIVGRTVADWGKILLFYLVYYVCLTSMFAIFMTLFFTTVSDTKPSQTAMDSILKDNPGMGFRPRPYVKDTLIKYKSGDETSYKPYYDDIEDYLDKRYREKEPSDGLKDCSTMDKPDPTVGCDFPISLLGDECTKEKKYGYHAGDGPCVLLKLNKIYGWNPEPYTNQTMKEASDDGKPVPAEYDPKNVFVTCEGENDGDVDNLGQVDLYPPQGFLGSYFPYERQENYEGPLVMAHLKNLKPGVIVMVWCKAWSLNIDHHKTDRGGSVHFEVLID